MPTWIQALRTWNETENGNKRWCIPKKGSDDYKKVRKLMQSGVTASDIKKRRTMLKGKWSRV